MNAMPLKAKQSRIDHMLDLVAFKHPRLAVMEAHVTSASIRDAPAEGSDAPNSSM